MRRSYRSHWVPRATRRARTGLGRPPPDHITLNAPVRAHLKPTYARCEVCSHVLARTGARLAVSDHMNAATHWRCDWKPFVHAVQHIWCRRSRLSCGTSAEHMTRLFIARAHMTQRENTVCHAVGRARSCLSTTLAAKAPHAQCSGGQWAASTDSSENSVGIERTRVPSNGNLVPVIQDANES